MQKHYAETQFRDGRVILLVDGEEVPPVFYGLTDLQDARCRTLLAQRNVANFSGAGIDLVQCDWDMRSGWTRDNKFDPAEFFENIEPVTRPGSKCRLVVRLHLNPPLWWMDEHPGEMTVYGVEHPFVEDDPRRLIAGDNFPSRRVSLASEAWLRDAGEVLADFCRRMDESERGSFIIGIQPACGMYGEWHLWAGPYDPDHSIPQTLFFRRYLKKKYGTAEALRKAWNDPDVTFDTAEIPSQKLRWTPVTCNYRNPELYQNVIDSYKAMMLVPAEDVVYFCRIIKESSSRPVLAGAFYTYYFGGGHNPLNGHLEPDLVLKSPFVDYLGAPAVYRIPRKPGNSCVSRGLLESCRLNRKLFLTEMDQPPEGACNSAPGGDPQRDDITINLMRRNVMEPFTRGMGLWYYDHRLQGPDICKNFGWWDTPVLMGEIARQAEIFRNYHKKPYSSEAEILCVWGTEDFYHTSGNDRYAPPVSMDEVWALEEISRCGVPYDNIFMTDLPLAQLEHYKVILVFYAGVLFQEQRKMLKEILFNSGKEVIFMNNAGYSDGSTLSEEHVKNFLGISVRAAGKHNFCTVMNETVSVTMPYVPLLRPDDPEAEVTAWFEDGAEPAGARKKYGDTTVWYFAFPLLPSGFLRELLRQKGAHIYCGKNLIVKAGRGILCCHAPADGPYDIVLKNGKVKKFRLALGETVILDAESGKMLV